AEPVDVRGVPVRPRDVLAALGRRLPQAQGVQDVECMRVIVRGSREGRTATVIAETVVGPDPDLPAGGGARDTGVPPSVVAQMIGAGEVGRPGMFSPEEVLDAGAFFVHLARRGITFTLRMDAGGDAS